MTVLDEGWIIVYEHPNRWRGPLHSPNANKPLYDSREKAEQAARYVYGPVRVVKAQVVEVPE